MGREEGGGFRTGLLGSNATFHLPILDKAVFPGDTSQGQGGHLQKDIQPGHQVHHTSTSQGQEGHLHKDVQPGHQLESMWKSLSFTLGVQQGEQ